MNMKIYVILNVLFFHQHWRIWEKNLFLKIAKYIWLFTIAFSNCHSTYIYLSQVNEPLWIHTFVLRRIKTLTDCPDGYNEYFLTLLENNNIQLLYCYLIMCQVQKEIVENNSVCFCSYNTWEFYHELR